MRIITGKYKGRKLFVPNDPGIRPTMDRVKESMFGIIGDLIEGKRVLSLFSGAGSLGLEALSRGASHVTFVDKGDVAINYISKNIEKLGVEMSQVTILKMDALTAIQRLKAAGDSFDFIFADPPYYNNYIKKTLLKLEGFDILSRFSYLVLEHSKKETIPQSDFYEILRTSRFGATYVTFCKKTS